MADIGGAFVSVRNRSDASQAARDVSHLAPISIPFIQQMYRSVANVSIHSDRTRTGLSSSLREVGMGQGAQHASSTQAVPPLLSLPLSAAAVAYCVLSENAFGTPKTA